MVAYTVWMLEKQNITVSGGGNLDGVTQGDGSHLVGLSITLNSSDWVQTTIEDNDTNFDDNDGTQALAGPQTINGANYASGTRVEAEYRIILSDGDGNTWTAYAYNVNNSATSFATVEGLVFRPDADGNFPPVGVPLTVTFASEGPSGEGTNPYSLYAEPPCFTLGTLIDTPSGPQAVESLKVGDLVLTRDHGAQPLRWIGRVVLTASHLAWHPEHQPICIAEGALAPGVPSQDLRLSPQHRVLVSGWKAELLFAETEVLVPAVALCNDRGISLARSAHEVVYLHLLFDRHEIIFAEGAAVESLHAPWLSRAPLPAALSAELHALFPEIMTGPASQSAVRPCLTVTEGRTLAG
ncbi:Hint domain-containing protein [Tabrizicola sp.]|uniref:Hint domain-containing protein n=1 Tax=Tabrizicola sp. TaxID=2005166 RepID=UPI00260FD4F1|nr:Hint domain-containing protein [Tabrizicola sp.]MDM7931198.1 Hint domain-containing protein [Tabrizicola sp.]